VWLNDITTRQRRTPGRRRTAVGQHRQSTAGSVNQTQYTINNPAPTDVAAAAPGSEQQPPRLTDSNGNCRGL
jgi:hypothetical protein